jgi:hypothetical protein
MRWERVEAGEAPDVGDGRTFYRCRGENRVAIQRWVRLVGCTPGWRRSRCLCRVGVVVQ